MRILFDHQVFSWQSYGGISRYFVEQFRELPKLGQEVLLPEHFYSENVYLRQLPDFQRPSLSRFSFKGKKYLQNLLGKRHSLKALSNYRPQVFHPTYFDPYFLPELKKQDIPFVLTIHDMIHEIYGHGQQHFFSLDKNVTANKRKLANEAPLIIAVSENTKQDILRYFPEIDPNKITVIHHGNSMMLSGTVPAIRLEPSPYLLFVGQRKAYKNFAGMVEEIAPILQESVDLKLVCIGGTTFDESENAQLQRLGIAEKVIYKRISSDEALAAYYSHAECFIFPSNYEGFGIPVLEAFACSCPVILNRASSLPEVGGEAALYFDSSLTGNLRETLSQFLADRALRDELISKGLERVKAFTWARSAARHLEAYKSVVGKQS